MKKFLSAEKMFVILQPENYFFGKEDKYNNNI